MSVHAGRPEDPEVYRITNAQTGLSQDQHTRTKRYLISMGIRTLCFLGAVIAPPPWRWILFIGALFLPYIAVVMANAGRDRQGGSGLEVVVRPDLPSLGSPPPPPPPPPPPQ